MTAAAFAFLPTDPPEPLPTAPCSRFYHLAPLGVGTPQVESLSSYLCRLAEAHHLAPQVLVLHTIRPALISRPAG